MTSDHEKNPSWAFTRRAVVLGVFTGLLSLCGCSGFSSGSDVWGVIYTSLPIKVSTENLDEPAVAYIFRQTHEPIFRQEDGENFRSKLLRKWKRNIHYTEFEFCPDTGMRFDKDNWFSPEYFLGYVKKTTVKYGVPYEAAAEEGCVRVRFKSGQPRYLRFLTQYRNAPSLVKGSIEQGLGAFSVVSISSAAIELERKERIRRGYNKIIIYPYGGAGDPNLQNRLIRDFNRISSFQWPEWMKKEYQGFDNIELRVVALAINHDDARVRKALYNCLDVDEFRRAAIPARKDFYDIQTLLPVGVPGARGGRPQQACEVPRQIKGREVVFANPRSDNRAELEAYARKFNEKTGLRLTIKSFRPVEMNPMLVSDKPRPFNLVVAVSDNPNNEPEDFFRLYAGESRAVDRISPAVKETYVRLVAEGYSEKKIMLAQKLASQIAEEWVALPLYQTTVKLYYPKQIKNLSVGRGFSEDPDVGGLRW